MLLTAPEYPPPKSPATVLLRVYANCIDGQATAANRRISDALNQPASG